jgi:HNH endonuclease
MYKDLVEHDRMKGFFKHPYLVDVYVSKSGLVYDDRYQKYFYIQNKGEYPRVAGLNQKHLHRIVCETFLPIPSDISQNRLVCNHKNGNKHDNRIENLEWISFSGNAEHAYREGLRKDNTPILVKDLRTNEVIRYYSLQEAARNHKVNGSIIFLYLNKRRGKIFQNNYTLIREGEDWPDVYRDQVGARCIGLSRETIVLDKKVGKYLIFDNVRHASEHLGVKMQTLDGRLRRSISKGLNGHDDEMFSIWFLDMFKEQIPNNTEKQKSTRPITVFKRSQRKQIPIIVTDLLTGEKKEFSSSEIFARSHGVKKNTFQKNIYQNKGIWKSKYHVQYIK